MTDHKRIDVAIDYETGKATIHATGILELCLIWREAGNRIIQQTGMEPEVFLEGMRELLAPVEP